MQDVEELRAGTRRQAKQNLDMFLQEHGWRTHLFETTSRLTQPGDLLDEFFFCLLGGYGITYEINALAYETLRSNGLLEKDIVLAPNYVAEVSQQLKQLPLREEEGIRYVSYRFPNNKAKTLAAAGKWLEEVAGWDLLFIYQTTPTESRDILTSCPGFGLKTASWLLRNIGHGEGLAILDVHIIRIAREWSWIPDGLTPQRDYLEIERRLQDTCTACNANIGSVDLALWHFSRGDFIDDSGQNRLF